MTEKTVGSRRFEIVAIVIGSAIVGLMSNSFQTAFFALQDNLFSNMPSIAFSTFCTVLTGVFMLLAAVITSRNTGFTKLVPLLYGALTGAGVIALFLAFVVHPVFAVIAVLTLSCGIGLGFLFWLVLTARFELEQALVILVAFRCFSAIGALGMKLVANTFIWLVCLAALYGVSVILARYVINTSAPAAFVPPRDTRVFELGPIAAQMREPIIFVSVLGFASGTMRGFFQAEQVIASSFIIFVSTLLGIAAFLIIHRKSFDEFKMLVVRLSTLLCITAVYLVVPFIDPGLLIICSGIIDVCYVAATMRMNLLCVEASREVPARAVVVLGLFKGCVFMSIGLGFVVNTALGAVFRENTQMQLVLSLLGIYVVLVITIVVVFRRLKFAMKSPEARPVLVNLSEEQIRQNKALTTMYGISEREMDVLVLALAGNGVSGIGKSLYLSENTVKTYLKRIYSKLDVHSRDELRQTVTELIKS